MAVITIKNIIQSEKQIGMLTRSLKFFCSESATHVRQLLRKCQTLEREINAASQKLTTVRQEVAEGDKKLNIRNKQIHQLRSQLTNDVLKGEKYWTDAKSKSEALKKESIQNFAKSLYQMRLALVNVKNLQKQTHDADLREGFDLTSRLFFSTLEKYKIVSLEPELKSKFSKDQMVPEGEVKAENDKEKGLVAKVTHPGLTVDGKVVQKAKVHVYV